MSTCKLTHASLLVLCSRAAYSKAEGQGAPCTWSTFRATRGFAADYASTCRYFARSCSSSRAAIASERAQSTSHFNLRAKPLHSFSEFEPRRYLYDLLTEPTIRKRRVPLLIAVSKSDLTQRAPEDVRSELEKEL